MIITRTPFRISLFGGGTDYPKWYQDHGGAVLGMAIDKYCYISLRRLPPFFAHRHRIVYSRIENVRELSEIEHPAVRAVLQEDGVEDGLEIHHDGDLPARSGMGSSSSFTVGLLHALSALRGRMATKRHLAEEAIRIEQHVIGENVGSQDQIWAAFGGLNRIDFRQDGAFTVSPLIVPRTRETELLGHMMLFFTGLSRHASEIARSQIENMGRRAAQLRAMRAMVDEAQSILANPGADIRLLGHMLNDAWMLKRELASNVTTGAIDEMYQAGCEAGAIGGKVLGAGGGGFVLFFVEPANQAAVRERLKSLIEVTFDIDTSGSSVVLYNPNGF
ncbi:kinase [Arenibaculum sp.]|jgi:D-glycero-alpha-D-manno-heptose-7-phosphate kinase|uniref:GHMP family kinase ATP-binding protein n=1 Tax=Arenibaculum sp. TaxID=2865862 RepID=UPI002E0E9A2C|nr:kinase [Arenibaculum sp.]